MYFIFLTSWPSQRRVAQGCGSEGGTSPLCLESTGGSHKHVLFECDCHRDVYLKEPQLLTGFDAQMECQCQHCGHQQSLKSLAQKLNVKYKDEWKEALSKDGMSRRDDSVPPILVPHYTVMELGQRTWLERHQDKLFKSIAGLVFPALQPQPTPGGLCLIFSDLYYTDDENDSMHSSKTECKAESSEDENDSGSTGRTLLNGESKQKGKPQFFRGHAQRQSEKKLMKRGWALQEILRYFQIYILKLLVLAET